MIETIYRGMLLGFGLTLGAGVAIGVAYLLSLLGISLAAVIDGLRRGRGV